MGSEVTSPARAPPTMITTLTMAASGCTCFMGIPLHMFVQPWHSVILSLSKLSTFSGVPKGNVAKFSKKTQGRAGGGDRDATEPPDRGIPGLRGVVALPRSWGWVYSPTPVGEAMGHAPGDMGK